LRTLIPQKDVHLLRVEEACGSCENGGLVWTIRCSLCCTIIVDLEILVEAWDELDSPLRKFVSDESL
jgi:hypothetical protein